MAKLRVRWIYTGLRVENLRRSIRFYERLGFKAGAIGHMGHGGQFVDLKFPGTPHALELNYYPRTNRFWEPLKGGTAFDHFGLVVNDIGAMVTRLRRAKMRIAADFSERSIRLVYVEDPDGNWLEFCGRIPSPVRRRRRRS